MSSAAGRGRDGSGAGVGVLVLLGAALLAILLAPLAMPDDYSWVELGVSESAAQGLEGAWVARIGSPAG